MYGGLSGWTFVPDVFWLCNFYLNSHIWSTTSQRSTPANLREKINTKKYSRRCRINHVTSINVSIKYPADGTVFIAGQFLDALWTKIRLNLPTPLRKHYVILVHNFLCCLQDLRPSWTTLLSASIWLLYLYLPLCPRRLTIGGRKMERQTWRIQHGLLLPPQNSSLVLLLVSWLATMDLVA